MPQEQFYDGAFAEIFHHPKFIRSLLTDFVDEEWVGYIDFSSMRIEEEEHKGMEDRPLRSDLVISFDFFAGPGGESVDSPAAEGFSIYLLLEFQSSAEPMSLRLLEYLSRIYRRQRRDCEQLRPVVPVVIYNGIPRWREDPDFSRHFVCIQDSLRPYLPLFRYILIDEGRYDEKILRKLKGAVAAFFRIDTVDLKNRNTAADRIIEVLREMRDRDPEVHRLLSRYIGGLLAWRGIENRRVEEYIKRRRKPMLAQRLEALREEGREEGLVEGREEGREEGFELGHQKGYGQGELKGKQISLLRQMAKKFSLVPEEERVIMGCEDSNKLDEALDVILFADTKAAVLESLSSGKP